MRNLKTILAVLLLVLSLLDSFDTYILTAVKSSSTTSSQNGNAIVAHHHHHQEEIVLSDDDDLSPTVEKKQRKLPHSNRIPAGSFLNTIWQPPKVA